MEEKKKNTKKDLEVINGDGKDLNISPVENHIKIERPNKNKTKDKKIVIPKSKNK